MSADRDRETREAELEANLAAWLYDHPSNYDRVSLCDQAADMIAGPLAPALRAVREHDALRRDLAALAEKLRSEAADWRRHLWLVRDAYTDAADRVQALLDGGEGGR